eukprot:TRINITY_DN107970_c0_g1_i1.p1 TRINITY_DN107970_c0_g1~~TRINITY_DN107970_c0_g1_i1.p1  ORF type:complete len:866 (-),score=183.12 TRINITY_DN107970_c0_g1_i1:87-2564(-)
MDVRSEAHRQLERAERLLEVGYSAPRGRRTPVHKSLEQLFGEARARSQTFGSVGGGAFGSASSLPRLLQTPQAQRLEREVADFTLAPQVSGGVPAARSESGDQPSLGLQEFFGLRHERIILETVEEAQRDCLRSCERHSFDRLQADWEEAKTQILGGLQRLGQSSAGLALCNDGGTSQVGPRAVPPPQDAQIIDALTGEPMSQQLVQRISKLSCASCAVHQTEIADCWSILGHELKTTLGGVTSGALGYLQNRFFEEVKSFVYGHSDARLGGIPDAWSIVRAFGRLKFQTASFPSTPEHVWYAAFVAARAGLASLLLELPERAAPCSDRCLLLQPICKVMARRLQATGSAGLASDFAGDAQVENADLLRADLQVSSEFHDVLVSLLLGKTFAFGRLPEGTVEDWLWYRLHSVHLAAKDDDQSPEFKTHLEALQQRAANLPPSNFDPGLVGTGSANGAGPSRATPDFGPGPSATLSQMLPQGGMTGATMQTLNPVKVLLLTAQFARAVQQLQSQDRSLNGVALHMSLVLHKAGTLDAVSSIEQPFNVPAFLCDYASKFACRDQLQYFKALDVRARVKALQQLLLQGSKGANEELLGFIDPNGRHRPGLLERTLQEDGMGDQAEFVELCAQAGRKACEQGQYREAIRLLHLGRCHSDVLQVLCRCLRLPIWREEVSASSTLQGEATLLAQDIQRFFDIYERNLDRYALSSKVWAVARKLYAARRFHALCDRGQPEAALNIFDQEQLLPFGTEQVSLAETSDEIWAEYPGVVGDYVRVLCHAASHGAVANYALRDRCRQLQAFLAARCNRLVLDQQTNAALASLAMCC